MAAARERRLATQDDTRGGGGAAYSMGNGGILHWVQNDREGGGGPHSGVAGPRSCPTRSGPERPAGVGAEGREVGGRC